MLQRVTTIIVVVLFVVLMRNTWQINNLTHELSLKRLALQQMTEQRDQYQREATETANQLDKAERLRRLAEADIKALQEELAEQAEDYQSLRQLIQRSPASDDGPVAPVLRDTLERLP